MMMIMMIIMMMMMMMMMTISKQITTSEIQKVPSSKEFHEWNIWILWLY